MKSNYTKVMVILAAVMSVLASIMQLLIHFNQHVFLDHLTVQLDEMVFNTFDIVCTILITVTYLISCIVILLASKQTGKIVGIIGIGMNLILNVICFLGNTIQTRLSYDKGTAYVAVSSTLHALRESLVSPFLLFSLIFLCIAFGTLLTVSNKQ